MWWAGTSAGMQLAGGYSASRAAKSAGKAGARLAMAETAETIRRTKAQQAMQVGQTIASIGGSGAQMSGTPSSYVAAMRRENMRELRWTQRAGKMRANLTKKTGSQVAQSAMIGGFTGAFSTISNRINQTNAATFEQKNTIASSGVVGD